MEIAFRTAAIDWLRADPALAELNAIEEESPLSASTPWLGLAASTSTDWSTKDRHGREVRIAFELMVRSDDPASCASLVDAIEQRLVGMPPTHPGFTVINAQFLRARAERRPNNRRATLLEYRFRILAN